MKLYIIYIFCKLNGIEEKEIGEYFEKFMKSGITLIFNILQTYTGLRLILSEGDNEVNKVSSRNSV